MTSKKGMQFVEPIRDLKKIAQIKNTLKGEENFRDLLLFQLGINSALRISDLLQVQVQHLFDTKGNVNENFVLEEAKTGKKHKVTITPKLKETILLYKEAYPALIKKADAYVFFNRRSKIPGEEPIGRKMAWLMISQWCKDAGLRGNYGGHTLRKTWGYQARMNGVTLEVIQHKLNHSSMSVTKRYLGITDDEIEDACMKLDL